MSNRTNLSTSYHYTVTAASDSSAYLWSGHGLENAPNPTIYLRTDDDLKITNASGGHIMELRYDVDPSAWTAVELNGEISVESPNPGDLLGASSFTYICQTHPAMTGKMIVSQPDVDGKSDDGYGTGPLPENNADGSRASISTDQIRTKINEIVTKGGIGGGSISVSDTPPDNPSEGDLWYDETAAALYVWIADPTNSWLQTGGGGGGGSIEVSAVAPASPSDGDLWFNTTDGKLYVYVASETAWFQTNGGSSGGGGGGVSEIINIAGGDLVNAGDAVTRNPVPEGEWLIHLQTMEQAGSNLDEDIVKVHSEKYSVPTGNYLWFKGTASSMFYLINTSTTMPATGDVGWIEITTNIDDGQGGSNSQLGAIWGFGLKLNGGGGGNAGGASVSTGDVAPATPADGDLWFNTVEAELYVYLDAEGAWIQTNGGGGVGSGNFSTGWVDTDGTTAVANGAALTFDHNLGTDDIIVQVYMAKDASGTDSIQVTNELVQSGGLNYEWGGMIKDVTSSGVSIELAQDGWVEFTGSGHAAGNWGTTYTHIKVVVSSGAGSGPRAYVAFDGTAADLTASITNSFNVASITDNGAGDYTINYTNPIIQPIITIGYEVRTTSPYHPLYWGVLDQTSTYARISLGVNRSFMSDNVYYDHPYVSFVAH